jgi:SAM-dependent methyltransferase
MNDALDEVLADIHCAVTNPSAPGQPLGTGYFVSKAHVVTCEHVVRDLPDKKAVLFHSQGATLRATVVETDPDNDCALLVIDTSGFAPSHFGELAKTVTVGAPWQAAGYSKAVHDALEKDGAANKLQSVRLSGTVQSKNAIAPDGKPSIELRSENVGADDVRGYSGAPVATGNGEVIGHIKSRVPGAAGGGQLEVLWACPAGPVNALLKRHKSKATTPGSERSGLLRLAAASQGLKGCAVGLADFEVQPVTLLETFGEALEKGRLDLRYHYLGPKCARNWISLSQDSVYGRVDDRVQLKTLFPTLVKAIKECRKLAGEESLTFISLGCGDGSIDRTILDHLAVADLAVANYVAVDISPELIQQALSTIRDSTRLRKLRPLWLLADIENLGRLKQIWPSTATVEVYSLLGYTFGNVGSKSGTLAPILEAMGPEDLLVVDARCYGQSIGTERNNWANVLGDELIRIYKHEANEAFAAGPLSFRTERVPAREEFEYEIARTSSPLESIEIRTELRLSEDWRTELQIEDRKNDRLVLAWSTVFLESALEQWFENRMKLKIRNRNQWRPVPEGFLSHNVYILSKAP